MSGDRGVSRTMASAVVSVSGSMHVCDELLRASGLDGGRSPPALSPPSDAATTTHA